MFPNHFFYERYHSFFHKSQDCFWNVPGIASHIPREHKTHQNRYPASAYLQNFRLKGIKKRCTLRKKWNRKSISTISRRSIKMFQTRSHDQSFWFIWWAMNMRDPERPWKSHGPCQRLWGHDSILTRQWQLLTYLWACVENHFKSCIALRWFRPLYSPYFQTTPDRQTPSREISHTALLDLGICPKILGNGPGPWNLGKWEDDLGIWVQAAPNGSFGIK